MVMKTIFLVGNGTFTVPSDWNNAWNTIYAIGQGGSGTNLGGGGGGACAYTENFYANPGDVLTYSAPCTNSTTIGLITAKYNGADAWISRTSVAPLFPSGGVFAKGGNSGDTRTGGTAAASVGQVKYSGGNGGTSGAQGGGGGGGSAGPNGNGANGGTQTISKGGGGGGSNGGSNASGSVVVNGISVAAGGNNRYGQSFMGAGGISGGVGLCDILWSQELDGKRAGPTGGDGGLTPGASGPEGNGTGGWGEQGSAPCFRAGTMISTPNGTIEIEKLKIDDLILAFDIGNSNNYSANLVPKKVTRTFSYSWNKKLLAITHDYGILYATGNHKILTSSHSEKYIRADLLKVGDIIYTADGKESQIKNISNTEESYELVYDIEVEDYHTFIADDIRVHNPQYFNNGFIFAGAGGSGIATGLSPDSLSLGGSALVVIQYVPITSVKTVILTGSVAGSTWTVPSDWNNLFNRIHGIGGGGGSDSNLGNGGGGGGYARLNNYLLNPGDITYWSATVSSTLNGDDSWFSRFNNKPGSIATGLVARGGKGSSGSIVGVGGGSGQESNIGDVRFNGGNGSTTQTNLYAGGGGSAGPSGNGGAGGTNPTNGIAPYQMGAGGGGANGGEIGEPMNSLSIRGGNGGNNIKGTGGGLGSTSGTTSASSGTDGGGGGGGFYNGSAGASNFSPGGQGGMQSIWTQSETISGSTTSAGSSVGPTGGAGAWAGYAENADGPGSYNPNIVATGFGSGGGSGVAKGGAGAIIIQYVPTTYFKTIFITSSQDYTVPADFDRNRNAIYAIGPGGSADATGGGGGGGSFAAIYNADLVPGGVYRANISSSTDTWFNFILLSAGGSSNPLNSYQGILARKGNNSAASTGATQVPLAENLGNIINRGGAGGNGQIGRGGGGGAGGLNGPGGTGGTGAQFCGGGGGGADGGSAGGTATNNSLGGNGGNNKFGYGSGTGATLSSASIQGLYGGGGGGGAGNGTGTSTNDNGAPGGIQRLFTQTSDGASTGPSGGGGGSGRDATSGTGGNGNVGGGAGSGNVLGTPGSGIIVLMYLPKSVQGNMILMF